MIQTGTHDTTAEHLRALPLAAVAERLSLSERTVRRMLQDGRLPGAVKIGRQWRVPVGALGETL